MSNKAKGKSKSKEVAKSPETKDGNPRKPGRPRKYERPIDLRNAIEKYFKDWAEAGKPITMAGMLSYIDLSDDGFGYYSDGSYDHHCAEEEEKGEDNFSETIKKARKFVEADKLERGLMGEYAPSVTIFDLKNNHGYVDKQEVNNVGAVRPVVVEFID